jgi:hypothetical protein
VVEVATVEVAAGGGGRWEVRGGRMEVGDGGGDGGGAFGGTVGGTVSGTVGGGWRGRLR